MPRGSVKGDKRSPGRPKGSRNKRTEALKIAMASSGLSPLEYLLQVMRDDGLPFHSRVQAATAAAPYIHAKLASTEVKVSGQLITEVRWRLAGA